MANFSNPIGSGLTPERIDMGVDFGGAGQLYALGHGIITSVFPLGGSSGWPSGGWVGLKLDDGREMYYAEGVAPLVRPGQVVNAGDHIANAIGGPNGIEVGWASGQGTSTEAAAAGQAKLGQSHGDAGAYSTAFGVDMANLIHSLGGPLGRTVDPVQGTLPANWKATPGGGSGVGTSSALSGILGLPSDVTKFFQDINTFITAIMWLADPSHLFRIGAFIAGTVFLLAGVWILFKSPGIPLPIPIPIP